MTGFGHPIHKETEPRADVLRRKVQELGGWGEKAQLFEAIHVALSQRLGKPPSTGSGQALPMNLAGMVAAVYCELGFDPVEIEALAAVGYGYAIVAHVVEEIREGVPLRVIPDALGATYTGPAERHIPDDR